MTDRMRRVQRAVKEVLSPEIGGRKDPPVGLVPGAGGGPRPDLRQATVYVSVLGPVRKREATLAGLNSSHGVLQAAINRELRLKRTPQLAFEYDPTVERGMRLSRLIDELAPDEHDDS